MSSIVFTRPNDYTILVVEPVHVFKSSNHEDEIVVNTFDPGAPLNWLVWDGHKTKWVVVAWHVENNSWTRTGAPLWDREELAPLRPLVRALSVSCRAEEIRMFAMVESAASAIDAIRMVMSKSVTLSNAIVDACASTWLELRKGANHGT